MDRVSAKILIVIAMVMSLVSIEHVLKSLTAQHIAEPKAIIRSPRC